MFLIHGYCPQSLASNLASQLLYRRHHITGRGPISTEKLESGKYVREKDFQPVGRMAAIRHKRKYREGPRSAQRGRGPQPNRLDQEEAERAEVWSHGSNRNAKNTKARRAAKTGSQTTLTNFSASLCAFAYFAFDSRHEFSADAVTS